MKRLTIEVMPVLRGPMRDTTLVVHGGDTAGKNLRDYLLGCSSFAKEHKVMLLTAPVIHEKQLCLMLFEADGMVSLRQPALFVPLDMPHLFAGDRLEVLQTEYGNIALCVEGDIHCPQVARTAALKGADVLFCVQQTDPNAMSEQNLRQTIWNTAQTNNLYAVLVACGQTAAACPAPLTRAQDGFLRHPGEKEPVWFGLNMDKLEEVRGQWPLLQNMNMRWIKNHESHLTR